MERLIFAWVEPDTPLLTEGEGGHLVVFFPDHFRDEVRRFGCVLGVDDETTSLRLQDEINSAYQVELFTPASEKYAEYFREYGAMCQIAKRFGIVEDRNQR